MNQDSGQFLRAETARASGDIIARKVSTRQQSGGMQRSNLSSSERSWNGTKMEEHSDSSIIRCANWTSDYEGANQLLNFLKQTLRY